MRKTIGFLLAFHCIPAFAHEFWLEPERFAPERDRPTRISIRIGENFQGNLWTPNSNPLARLVVLPPGGKLDLTQKLAQPGAEALIVEKAEPGTTIVALATENKFIEIDPKKFGEYLVDDGLDVAASWRAAHGETEKPGRELYRREAATLLETGAPTDIDLRATGFDLQIVPDHNPYGLRAGETLRVQILWRGAPLSNALVQRWTRKEPDGVDVAKSRTDAAGYVAFPMMRGPTMVSTVHMAENGDKTKADWQSVWGSLTFEAP